MRAIRGLVAAFAAPLTFAGVGMATPAFAQEEGNAQAAQEEGEGQSVLVTAQRREERLQDVPISVAVVGPQQLDAFEMNEATDLQYLVPGLAAPTQAGPRNFGFFVRGVGTTTFSSETIEPSTAFVVDGVVMGQGGASLVDLPDIERIEVLRGPQSTLFGKNSSAGVINVITRRPSETFEFRGSASWAWPDNDRRISGYVSGPLSDTVRFSLSGRRNVRDGYVTNAFDGREFNNRDEFGFRGKLEFEPTSALRVTLIGDYWERSADCCIWTFERFGPPGGGPDFLEQLALAAGVVPGRENLQQNIDGDVFSDSSNYGTSLQLDYTFGSGYTLTSISAWRTFETRDGLDSDSSVFDILNTNYGDHTQRQISQELRLASPTGGVVDYVAGLFYFRTNVDSFTRQFFPTVPFPFFDRAVFVDATTRNMAAFGQANIHATDALTFILGARFISERQRVAKERTDARLALSDSATASETDEALTWRGGVQYSFTRDIMAFATVTRGFKGGGFDTNIAVQELRPIGPERPTSYEIGLRAAWPRARLTLNITAFKADIEGYQTASRDPVTLTFPIQNGDASTQGVEMELSWRPIGDADFYLNGGIVYTDAHWGSFTDAPCFGGQTVAQGCVGGVQDLTGDPLPFAPRWALNLSADYSRPVGNSFKIGGSFQIGYRSRQFIGFPNGPDQVEPGYALANASIGFGAANDRWRISLFAKNLTDEHFRSFSFNTASGSRGMYRVYESQRILGVGLDVAF